MSSAPGWRRAATNVLALSSGSALSRGLAAVTMIVIARQVGPQVYGEFSSAVAVAALVSSLFSLGLDGWLLYQGGHEPEELGASAASALLLRGVLGPLWLAGLWVLGPALDQDAFPRVLLLLAGLALWIEGINQIAWSTFKARLQNDLTLALMTAASLLFLGITLALAARQEQASTAYMGGRLGAALAATLISGLLLARRARLHLRPERLRATIRKTLPYAASVLFAAIYGRADLAIVANELGSGASGEYAPALNLVSALSLVPAAIFGVMVPFLGRQAASDPAGVRRTALRLVALTTVAGVASGLVLAAVARPLVILLYGQPFQASSNSLALLGGVLALRFPNMTLAAILVAIGWQTRRVVVQGVAAAANVVINLAIVHRAGVQGVAIVYVVTEMVLLVGCLSLFAVWARARVGPSPRAVA
jgi:O-antigen/teichoic acid export membrane protein